MADVKYYLKERLVPGKGALCLAFTNDGVNLGAYKAFYYPNRGTVMLYPSAQSCVMPRFRKHEVGIRLLIKDF